MLYEILGITTITAYTFIRKEEYKQKLFELSFNLFLYGGLYNLTKTINPSLNEDYLFLTPLLFGIATISEYLKQKEQKNHEKTISDLERRVKELE